MSIFEPLSDGNSIKIPFIDRLHFTRGKEAALDFLSSLFSTFELEIIFSV